MSRLEPWPKKKENKKQIYAKKLSGQQSIFKKRNSSQQAATHASYVVAYNIAKSNKTLPVGEFIKHCMLKFCDILSSQKKSFWNNKLISENSDF
jgi:hypothetical protein